MAQKEGALNFVWDGDKLTGVFINCPTASDTQPIPLDYELVRIFDEHEQLQAENKQLKGNCMCMDCGKIIKTTEGQNYAYKIYFSQG